MAAAEKAWHEPQLLDGAPPEQLRQADTVGVDAGAVVSAWQEWASTPAVSGPGPTT
jgi:hypothetical protein